MSDGKKILDFAIQAGQVTNEVLKNVMRDFLSGKMQKSGKKRYGKLAKSGKLENIKITDSNIKDFLQTAKKYDIDFALKKDKSTSPATYHIFFESSHTENFKKAFSEYALGIKKSLDKKSVTQVVNREQIKQNAKTISRQQADKSVEKSKNKSDMGR